MEIKQGFDITRNKGFHIKFENGWTVSVQFGYGNYCDNYDYRKFGDGSGLSEFTGPFPASRTAEVAAWPANGEMIVLDDGDTVGNRYSPAQVLALMNRVAAMPASADTRPKDEDALAASLASGAVGEAETPTPPHPHTPGELQ